MGLGACSWRWKNTGDDMVQDRRLRLKSISFHFRDVYKDLETFADRTLIRGTVSSAFGTATWSTEQKNDVTVLTHRVMDIVELLQRLLDEMAEGT